MAPAERRVDILLVGGGVASARCARTLRRHGFRGSILLVGEEPRAPYNRPPLSKELLRGEVAAELVAVEPDGWYARQAVELLLGIEVVALAVDERRAQLSDGSSVTFGDCLIATGAEPRRPPIPGAEEAHLLRTVGDAEALRGAAVDAGAGAPAVVIGGGFIGVEVAASLAEGGLAVTLLELSHSLWSGSLGHTISSWAAERLRRLGVSVRLGAPAGAIEAERVVIGQEAVAARIVVTGVGVQPRTALAERAGLKVDDGVVVDERGSAAPHIFAAGDVARAPHPIAGGRPIRVEHWHAAREGGERAALAMLGEAAAPPRAPWVYTEFAGQLIDVVGWLPPSASTQARDDERLLGDPASGRFAVATLVEGRVAQVAVVNGYVAVEAARALVEAGSAEASLGELR